MTKLSSHSVFVRWPWEHSSLDIICGSEFVVYVAGHVLNYEPLIYKMVLCCGVDRVAASDLPRRRGRRAERQAGLRGSPDRKSGCSGPRTSRYPLLVSGNTDPSGKRKFGQISQEN